MKLYVLQFVQCQLISAEIELDYIDDNAYVIFILLVVELVLCNYFFGDPIAFCIARLSLVCYKASLFLKTTLNYISLVATCISHFAQPTFIIFPPPPCLFSFLSFLATRLLPLFLLALVFFPRPGLFHQFLRTFLSNVPNVSCSNVLPLVLQNKLFSSPLAQDLYAFSKLSRFEEAMKIKIFLKLCHSNLLVWYFSKHSSKYKPVALLSSNLQTENYPKYSYEYFQN